MPREELTPAARAQLDALERILAREPVGEEHLELAALVESVRANAPSMDPAFARRLGAQVRERPARRRRRPIRAPRRLALATGGLLAAAVALAIVLSSGLLEGATHPAVRAQGGNGSFAAAQSPTRHGPARARAPKAFSGAAAPENAVPAPARLLQRSSMLVLASPVAALQRVANEVIAQTEHAGGVVASSYVGLAGPASEASFTLHVPATQMHSLIATLSTLAGVRSLTQATVDITGSYRSTLAAIATLEAQRATLQRELADAATSTAAASIRHRLHAVSADLAAQRAAGARLEAKGDTATLHVRLGVAAARAHHSAAAAGGSGGKLGRAARHALAALEDVLAVALVALAIALPVALSALAVWWLWAALRQRARERVFTAS